MKSLALLVASLGTAVSGSAQSINVDVNMNTDPELGGGPPSSLFGGAAGQPGFWNAIPTGNSGPFEMLGLNGQTIGVTLSATGSGGGGAWNNSVNTGDFKLLLNDADAISVGFEYTLTGLAPGPYRVHTFCIKPNGQFGEAFITVPGALTPTKHAAGVMPGNQLIEGITHTSHDILLTGGLLRVQASGPWPNAYINGFQIAAVPEPACTCTLLLGAAVLCRRRCRR